MKLTSQLTTLDMPNSDCRHRQHILRIVQVDSLPEPAALLAVMGEAPSPVEC